MLRQRVITALLLLAVLLPSLWVASPWPFALFVLVLAAAGTWEWARLLGMGPALAWGSGAAVPLGVLAWWWAQGVGTGLGSAWAAVALGWVLLLWPLLRGGPAAWTAWPRAAKLVLGLGVMFSTALALVDLRAQGVNTLLSVMCIVWAADIAAYFAGRRFGRRKLAPSLSPGKTWEGVYGAAVGVALLAALWLALEARWPLGSPSVFAQLQAQWGPWGLPLACALLMGLGVVGDLFESLMKRAVGAKDSSQLLPGHGGVLDRVDALLPVLPMALALMHWGRA